VRVLWILACAAACAKQSGTAEVAAAAASPHPDLVCPPPLVPAGLAPPQGWEVWCQVPLPTGTFQRQGPSIAWHSNEQRSAEGTWSAGKKSGTWQYWFPTGQLEKTGNYVNGVEDGVWVNYHPTGQRAGEGQMVDGKENGEWTYWSEDGTTRTVGRWSLGLRDGVWTDFGAGDEPLREKVFRGGRMVSQKEIQKQP
jgi:antitoxin component YwqK of YwqJK toxin-antitoxin module